MIGPLQLLLLIVALGLLITLVQLGLLSIAFDKLGLSQSSAFLLLFSSLAGSLVNLPLFRIKSTVPPERLPSPWFRWLGLPPPAAGDRTIIAVNLGGGVIPVAFSAYLMVMHALALSHALLAVAIVSVVSYLASRPIPGVGIGMPIFVAPIAAALAGLLISPEQSAPLAYVGGTLGVLVGADLLRLRDIGRMGTPVASIGGAGTFDGIFLTGLVAVLLA